MAPSRNRLTDTVKLLAYRAETALATIVREQLSHAQEARALLRDLFRSDADLHPDGAAGVLKVRVHALATPRSNRAIQHLLDHVTLLRKVAAPPMCHPERSEESRLFDGELRPFASLRVTPCAVLLNAAECTYPGTNLRLTYALTPAPPK